LVARRTDEEHLRDPEFQLGVLRYREDRLLGSAARRLKHRMEAGTDGFSALIECQDHLLALARAHVERRMLEEFIRATESAEPALRPVLNRLRELFALSVLEREEGWLLEHGVFEGSKGEAVRALVNRTCRELRPHAVSLVDAFGIPDEIVGAPIAVAASR
jgi:acyl-CoA oxidase